MKIKTFEGLCDIDDVFEGIPIEIYPYLKEGMTIEKVLEVIDIYEKPIRVVKDFLRLRAKFNWTEMDLKNLNKIKVNNYYIKREYINDLKDVSDVNKFYQKDREKLRKKNK